VKPISAGEDDSTTPKDQSRASPRIKAYSFAARPQVIQAVGCEYGISEIEMKIRPFQDADAAFCFRVRSSAFIRKFYGELAPREVTAAVNAYLPEDFIRMAKEATFFIVEQDDAPLGFFNLRRKDKCTAELPLIYLDLDHLGRGIGSACVDFMEKWLLENWPEVNTLIVDTVIPKYNSGFYKKVGFKPSEITYCEFLGHKLKALRLVKELRD
jgi:GNAT superfamily N-acetyltransferase